LENKKHADRRFPEDHRKKKRKKKKRLPLWAKIVIIIALVLVGMFIVGMAFIHSKLNLINKVDTSQITLVPRDEETFETDGGDASADTITPDEITWDGVDINVMKDQNVSNILLIGQDARPGEGRARSDSMIIVSINKNTNEITMASIMRDMYVPIPGYSDNRINAAYQFGGMPLLDQVIEESLGIHIDGNIEVNFEGFINAFTQIGNIDIELYQAEADHLNKQNSSWNLKEGMNSLTPEQALAYSRIRYVGNSDWERTDRQRKVLMAAFNKVSGGNVFDLINMANAVFPYLTTDMNNDQILGYVYTVATSGMKMGENYRIPVDGTYTNETLRAGMEVLVPDLNENSALLQEYLYGTTAYE
jgi:LCP family protein required for cell wall assembly